MAVTGLTKAAKSVGNYLGRKSLKVVARANRTADKASDATANLVRKAVKASDAIDNATLGPIGKATRNASAAVIKATRHTRPRARETMGQINRRKGIVNKVHYPSQMDEHVKDKNNMDKAMNIWKNQGMGKIGNQPNDIKNRMRGNNIKFRDESVRPKYMHEMPNSKPMNNFDGKVKQPAFDRSKLSYEDIKPMGRSGPRYTSKQVKAGRKVAIGGAATYAASQYFKDKKSSR
jgi:hypothetical protein